MSAGQQLAQQIGVVLARRHAARRKVLGHRLWRVTFDHKQAGGGHADNWESRSGGLMMPRYGEDVAD